VAAAVALLLTSWLSLGPVVQGGGHALPVPALYALLYDHAPGFRGVRAVGRYAMLFFFFLAVLAGLGVAYVESYSRRAAQALALVACSLFLWQTRPSPFPLDRAWPFVSDGLAPVPEYLRPEPRPPAVYAFIATLDRAAVLAEFPFGDDAYDLRYMYFSAAHRRRMLAGFSGVFPDVYLARKAVLEQPLAQPDAAWTALAGATVAIVHARAWRDETGERIARWLQDHGAREAGVFDGARVFELRKP
jgi:MFS family permease